MYDYLVGVISEIDSPNIILDVNDVGYKIASSENTIALLSGTEGKVKLYTHLFNREDGFYLYGFATKAERSLFFELLNVPKIGPKSALALLSVFTIEQLIFTIASQDWKSLSAAPGIGKKTAEQIIVTLKDKFDNIDLSEGIESTNDTNTTGGVKNDALLALTSLGFDRSYAMSLINEVYSEECTLEEIISRALVSVNR